MKKKTIHRSNLQRYSRGEGMTQYYSQDRLRHNERVARLEQEEEDRRKSFVNDYMSSKQDKMTEEDIQAYKEANTAYYDLSKFAEKNHPNKPLSGFPIIGDVLGSLIGGIPVVDHMFNPHYTKEAEDTRHAISYYEDVIKEIENKYTPEALYNAGFTAPMNLLLERANSGGKSYTDNILQGVRDKLKDAWNLNWTNQNTQVDQDQQKFNSLTPQQPIVELNLQGVQEEVQEPENIYNISPFQTPSNESKANLRKNIIKDISDRYLYARANYEYDNQSGRVSKPDGYGFWSSAWWNDAIGTYLERLNDTQAQTNLGKITVSQERLNRAKNAVAYLDAIQKKEKYNQMAKDGHAFTHEELQDIYKADEDKAAFADDYYYIQTLIPGEGPLGVLDAFDNARMFLNKASVPQDFGVEWFDYNDLIRKYLRGIDSNDYDTRHKALAGFEQQVNKYDDIWKKGAEVNFKEAEDARQKYNVSQWFKQQEGTVSDDFFSLDSWLYKQPGLLGASQSSALKSWTSTALNLVGGGLLKGIGKKLLLGATTLPIQVSASEEENYAEVGDNYTQRLKGMLKRNGEYEKFVKEASEKLGTEDEEEVFNQFLMGNFIPTSKKQLEIAEMASYGAGALYQSDMMATTFDDVFTTALELTPLGHLSKATRLGKISKSAMSGAALGPAGALGKIGIDYTAERIAKSSIGKSLAKRTAALTEFAKEIPEKLLGKKAVERLSVLSGKNSIPHRVLGPRGYMRYAAVKKVGKDITGRAFRSSISEGIEEGKQYLNAQRYLQGEYDNEGYMGLLNSTRFINDTYALAKSAYVMAGFPLFLNLTDDSELIANIKGGMKGGFMQTGVTSTVQSALPLYQMLKWGDVVYNNAMLEKASERDFWEKGIMFAQKALGGANFEYINESFDNLISSVNQKGKTKEDIDAAVELINKQRDMAKRIFNIADSNLVKKALKNNNIDEDSEDAAKLISLINLIGIQHQEASEKSSNQAVQLQKLINTIDSPFEVENGTQNVIDRRIYDITGDILQSYVKPEEGRDGELIVGKELARVSDLWFRTSTTNLINIIALQQLKKDLNTAKQSGVQFGQSKRDIDFLLKYVDKQLEDNLKLFKEDKRDTIIQNADQLIADVKDKDKIVEEARLNFLYDSEEQYYNAMLNGIIGTYTENEEDGMKLPTSQFNGAKLIQDIEASIDRDYLLAQNIEQEWQNVFFQRSQAMENLRRSKLKKAAEKQRKDEENKKASNKPESVSDNAEKSETGKERKKRKSLKDKIGQNRKKQSNKKQQQVKQQPQNVQPEDFVIETPQSQQEQQPVVEQPEQYVQNQNVVAQQPAQPVQQQQVNRPIQPQSQQTAQQSVQQPAPQSPVQQNQTPEKPVTPEQPQLPKDRGIYASVEDAEEADRIRKEMYRRAYGQLNSGFDPTFYALGIKLAYLNLKGRAVHISEFATNMVKDFGDIIRPYIKGMYEAAKRSLEYEGYDISGLSPVEDINTFDPDTFDKGNGNGPVVPSSQLPTGEPGDNQAAADRAFSTDDQKNAFNRLQSKVADDEQKIDINLRTSHDYFIKVNGKLVMYPRVHDYLDPQYNPNQEEIDHEVLVTKELRQAYNTSFDEFQKKAQEFADKFNEDFKGFGGFQKISLDTYFQYAKDNPNEIDDVIEAIANMTSRIPADESVIMGQLVDDICRQFFNGKEVQYTPEVEKYMSKKVFDEFIDQLKQIKKHYDGLGWVLFADPIRFYTEFYDKKANRKRRIAGETDMIAVDKFGHYHIIDFKTSYKSYADKLGPSGARVNNLDTLTEGPALNDRRAKVRTTREYYSDQQTAYGVMVEHSLSGAIVDSMELLPFHLQYVFQWVPRTTPLGQSISRVITSAEQPILGINNISNVINQNNEYETQNGELVKSVLRVPIVRQTGIVEKLLTLDQKQRFESIRDQFHIDVQEYYDSLGNEDKAAVSQDTIAEINDIYKELLRIKSIYPQTIEDWIQVFKQLEALQDRSKNAIQLIDSDIEKAIEAKRAELNAKDLKLLYEESFIEEYRDFGKNVENTFRTEVGEIYKTVLRWYKQGVSSIGDVDGLELTDLDQHIANVEYMIQTFPDYVKNQPGAMQYYDYAIKWLKKTIGDVAPKQTPQMILEKSFVDENSDQWRNMTTTWKASIDGSLGIEDSVAEDNPSMKLLQVTANPDFITDSVFELSILPIKINGKIQNRLHLTVHYKGHTYKPVSLHTAEGSSIFNQVYHLQKTLAKGEKIILDNASVSRTNGRIIVSSLDTLSKKGLVSDPWTIEYSSNQNTFGITRHRKNPKTNLNEIVAVVPGMDGGNKQELYNYGPNTSMNEGMVVMMVKPIQNEHTTNKPSVPVNLFGSLLSKEDADLIVGILKGNFVNRQNGERFSREFLDREFYENGTGKGFTNRQILNMLIPYGGRKHQNMRVLHLAYDGNNAHIIHIYGYVQGEQYIYNNDGMIIEKDHPFDISTARGEQEFINFLTQNVKINIDESIISQRLMLGLNESHPFYGLKKFLDKPSGRKLFNAGGTLTFGKSRIKFDLSDVHNQNNPTETRGLSGLGYFIKRGLIQSNFGGIENTLLSIDANPVLRKSQSAQQVQNQPQQPVQTQLQNARPANSANPSRVITDDDLVLDKIIYDNPSKKLAPERKVLKHLYRIFGESGVPVKIVPKVIEVLRQDASVVGKCWADAIELSEQAPEGTEYHEAFHRVAEILMTEDERNDLYDMYRKAHKMPVPTSKAKRKESDKQVREDIADSFMYFMSGRPRFKDYNYYKVFSYLKEWSDWFKNVGSFKLFWFYTKVGILGKYKNTKANEESSKRFKKLFPNGLNMIINNRPFEYVLNRHMYRELRKAFVFFVFDANTIDDTGSNISTLSIEKEDILKSRALQWCLNSSVVQDNIKDAINELLNNWEAVKGDIAADVADISTDYMKRFEQENEEDAQSLEDAQYAQIEQHIKASYEFSQFHRTSSMVRFFFSRVPLASLKRDPNTGQFKKVLKLNEIGLPQYMDSKFVFNSVLNKLWNIQSKGELLQRLKELSTTDAIYFDIYNRMLALSERAKTNQDDAQLFTQIFGVLRSVKNEFEIAKAVQTGQDQWAIRIISSDSEYSARNYKREWSDAFANGGSLFVRKDENGRIVMRGYRPSVFNQMAVRMDEIRYAFSAESEQPDAKPRIVKGEVLDISKEEDIDKAKYNLVLMLNQLGIQFDINMLDYMLFDKYKDTGYKGMKMLFSEDFSKRSNSSSSSFQQFIQLINSLYKDGKLAINSENHFEYNGSKIDADHIFEKAGASFVSELSTYKYNYRHQHDQLSVLATKGNRFYVISENDLISDYTQDLRNALKGWTEDVEEGMGFDYNLLIPKTEEFIGNKRAYGSIIYKLIKDVRDGKVIAPDIRLITFAGFKSDAIGDQGEDYMGISTREDFVSKLNILLDGGLIFPTMSDKKSWKYLRGIQLPGINHKLPYTLGSLNKFRPDGSMSQLHSVTQQLLEYALCERSAIQSCLREINGYTDEQGIVHPPLREEEKIDNYHGIKVKIKEGTPDEKNITVIQGARFTSLLGVYKDGKYIEFNRILDENGKVLTEEDNLKIADKAFFDAQTITDPVTGEERLETEDETYERQLRQIEEVLQRQLVDELEYAESLGLIERNADLEGRPSIEQYRNIGLNNSKIQAIAKVLAESESIDLDQLTTAQDDIRALYEARAISVLMNDVMVKHIMSIEEVERVYSGHPSFFKFKYDSKGHLVDRTTDQSKRLGGLISTGLNNDLELGLPQEYTQAEVANEVILSESIEDIRKFMVEGELRSAYLQNLLDLNSITWEDERAAELAKQAETMSLEKIKNNIPEVAYNIAMELAAKKISDFEKGTDLDDGAAYITDEMCENLLKMAGSWNSQVEKAFNVLRGNVRNSIEDTEAYNLIWTTVIGAQKYSAYGFRHQRGVQIPYYNKMALFPLFKCICTGNMAKVYDKMKQDGIDMLCTKGAVKLGGQGCKEINWNDYNDKYTFEENFHFNSYKQKYKHIRKQFNTDPKEDSEAMHIGTQMRKVVFAAMMAGREYTLQDGTKMSAAEIRDDVMRCMNSISDIGWKNIHDQFFDGNGFNVEKFSKFLTEELIDRNASQELIDAVSIVKDKDGKPHFKVPLSAISNLNFIQSIIAAKVNKEVIDINMPGAPFIQRSVWAMEGHTRVLGDENLAQDLNNGEHLKMVNEEGSMDCVLSIDFFDNLLPKKNGKRMSFKEAKQYLIDNGIISGVKSGETEWSNAKCNIIGYRIPTQAISSIHALRCVDVIPAVRDTVILPAEFTTITGSDFDIDKLYLTFKNYRRVGVEDYNWAEGNEVHGLGNQYDIKHRKLTDKYEEGSSEQLQNRLFDDYVALLTDMVEDKNGKKTSRSMHMLHASIDGDTRLITDISKDFESGLKKNPLRPYDAYMLRKQCSSKEAFATGKFGIGPFALNNNNHILTMLYNVKFKEEKGSILTRLNMNRLDRSKDIDGRSILSWISGLINIHVDAAKDPVADKVNIGKYTYNLINLMIRTGFGKRTLWFTSQPIMRALAEAYSNAQSSYMSDQEVSKYTRTKEAEEAVVLNFAKANGYTEEQTSDIDTLTKAWTNGISSMVDVNDLIDYLLVKGSNVLHDIAKSSYGDSKNLSRNEQYNVTVNGQNFMLSFFDIQMAVYMAKQQLDPYAEALSDLVKYTKIDTKKQGKTVPEQMHYKKGFDDLFGEHSKHKNRVLFDTKSLERLKSGSYIGHVTDNAISSFMSILGNTSVQATESFQKQVTELMSITQNDDFSNGSTIKQISGELLAMRKADFFNSYAKRHNIDIDGLVNGNNTLYDRLGRLKVLIMSDPKYKYLRGDDGEVSNYMLRTLIQGYKYKYTDALNTGLGTVRDQYNNAKFLDTFTFIDDESVNADDFSEAWLELLNDGTQPELQEFARDLVVYSFIVAGDNGGNHDLFKFVPNEWKINPENENIEGKVYSDNSYAAYMENMLMQYKSGGILATLSDKDKDDVILNNWFDTTFIKVERIVKNNETRFTPIYAGNIKGVNEIQVAGAGTVQMPFNERISFPSVLLGITQTPNGWNVTYDPRYCPKYIKIRRSTCKDKESQRRFIIYKYVADGLRYDEKGNKIFYPVYAMVDPRGNKFNRGNRILSYGRKSLVEEAMTMAAKVNPMINKYYSNLSPEENNDLTTLFLGIARKYTTWEQKFKDLVPKAAGEQVGTVISELAERMKPTDIQDALVEEWSQKEGWSKEYFYKNIFPRLSHAYQIEYELLEDQNTPYKKSVRMDMKYNGESRPEVTSLSTIEAIKNGERTATTRFDDNEHFDYWRGIQVGDVIEMHDDEGNSVRVVCTSTITSLEEMFGILPDGVEIKQDASTSQPGSAQTGSTMQFTYSRYPDGRPNYEVSSDGDSRFSAMNARFASGTKLLGHDVGGRTIESVYQHGVKQGDWITDNNKKTGAPKDKTIIKGNTENDSYIEGYLPLWKEWAIQNPQLIEELRRNAAGKVLTDKFASTKVSQARALADILNQTADPKKRPLPKFAGISEQDVRKAINLAENSLERAQGVVYKIEYNARYRRMSEQDQQDLREFRKRVNENTELLNGLYDGSSEIIINQYNVPQVVKKRSAQKMVKAQTNSTNSIEATKEQLNRLGVLKKKECGW